MFYNKDNAEGNVIKNSAEFVLTMSCFIYKAIQCVEQNV